MKNQLLNSLSAIFSGWYERSKKVGDRVFHERSIFRKLVQLERDRAHRGNQQFSVILINVSQEKKLMVTELMHHISRRVRRIDQVGWYDQFHIGVLLPSTSPDAAHRIAKDIFLNYAHPQASVQYQTLSYPDAN